MQAKNLESKSVYNNLVSASALTGQIRTVDPAHDLEKIADLIELCFAHQMDEDGRDYLRHIRRAARDPNYQRWTRGSNEQVPVPLFGYVWEENGKIVGNLTLIPFHRGNIWRYLAANIATHPDYRGRGIAYQLTQTAIDHVRQHKASAIWLQVRDDNPAAHNLYLALGFEERARRTTWEVGEPPPPLLSLNNHHIASRRRIEWPLEEKWLLDVYPPEVAWNLNLRLERYAPGFWRALTYFFYNDHIEQWAVHRNDELLGIGIWDAGVYNAETVWIAPNPACEDESLCALLTLLRREVIAPHPMTINYPAGRGEAAFKKAGFSIHNTLIWMEINFDQKTQLNSS
jgi:ribosomal protein S18 acetylase RimI-like enzyme